MLRHSREIRMQKFKMGGPRQRSFIRQSDQASVTALQARHCYFFYFEVAWDCLFFLELVQVLSLVGLAGSSLYLSKESVDHKFRSCLCRAPSNHSTRRKSTTGWSMKTTTARR
jgi:hypothetical protein